MSSEPKPKRCRATSRGTGRQCKRAPVPGATVCRYHGGATRHVRVRAAVRAELEAWQPGAATVDPGETLLRLLSQSWVRVGLYGRLLEQAYAGDPAFPAAFRGAGVAALIGHKYDLTRAGAPVAVEEATRGLVRLEADERDRCARFAKLALDAGIAERQVRLAEQQGAMLAEVIRRVLDAVGLSAEQAAVAAVAVPRELRAIGGAA